MRVVVLSAVARSVCGVGAARVPICFVVFAATATIVDGGDGGGGELVFVVAAVRIEIPCDNWIVIGVVKVASAAVKRKLVAQSRVQMRQINELIKILKQNKNKKTFAN